MGHREPEIDILGRCWGLGDQDALLAVHAILSQRPQVPRIYVPRDGFFTDEMVQCCLLSSLEDWNAKTWASLKETDIFPHMLRELRPKQSRICREIIEAALFDLLGPGEIHYEMARFTPFTHEDCCRYIGRFPLDASHVIFRSLAARMTSRESYTNIHGDCSKIANRIEGPDAQLFILMEKIDREWQKSWKSELRYLPPQDTAFGGVDVDK